MKLVYNGKEKDEALNLSVAISRWTKVLSCKCLVSATISTSPKTLLTFPLQFNQYHGWVVSH